ncbi:MAG: ParB/RepB/Spo0J family partition protein [Myxococcota bacterium]
MSRPKGGRRALGRGLDALLPPSKTPAQAQAYGAKAVFECPIERVVPRSDQPRRVFDKQALEDLAGTIAEHGIIQPIVVRRLGGANAAHEEKFEIIAGERRWRASQKAGLKSVPVVVKDITPDTAFELALIENVQRQDLNPVEVAEALQRLLDDHGFTQDVLAKRVGKSRVAVTNSLRLLNLPDRVRDLISEGQLSEGHGRALLGADDIETMVSVAEKAVGGKLSVRKVEKLIRDQRGEARPKGRASADAKSASVRDLEDRLTRRLGARTLVEHAGPGGKIVVRYNDLDDLDRIIETLSL